MHDERQSNGPCPAVSLPSRHIWFTAFRRISSYTTHLLQHILIPKSSPVQTPSALSDSLAAAGRQSNGRSEPQTPTITEGKEFSPEVPAEPGKKRKGSRGVWQGKNAVIEQLNELIDELDEIALNIAQQVNTESLLTLCTRPIADS